MLKKLGAKYFSLVEMSLSKLGRECIWTSARVGQGIKETLKRLKMRGGRGHKSPKFYNKVFLFVGDFCWILIGWFIRLSVLTFHPTILIYRRINFVYHQWVCTSIYQPLSYPFRSLKQCHSEILIEIWY